MSAHKVRFDLDLYDTAQTISSTDGETVGGAESWGMNLVFVISAGAETRKIPAPKHAGMRRDISVSEDGGGTVAITIQDGSTINKTGNTTITLGTVNDTLTLESFNIGGTPKWRVTYNDGAALS